MTQPPAVSQRLASLAFNARWNVEKTMMHKLVNDDQRTKNNQKVFHAKFVRFELNGQIVRACIRTQVYVCLK